VAVVVGLLGGCRLDGLFQYTPEEAVHFVEVAGQIQYDDTEVIHTGLDDVRNTPPPLTLENAKPSDYQNLTLEQVIEIGLRNSKVLRDLGGTVLRTPATVRTIHGPAIAETDPRFGTEGALSAFDPQFMTSAFFENNDRALNNTFFGGGTRTLIQDFNVYQTQVTQRLATGTQVTLRNNTVYDANNAPGNLFRSAWDTNIEAELRQPLLQGAGTFFNRIAGPDATPGLVNGLLIARVNRDVSLTNFQLALRDYVANVENAYWDLYFAYHELAAKKTARDKSLETWRTIRANQGRRGFEADKEAQAREQYNRFQIDVQEALSNRIQDGTRTNNGSGGGTFRRVGGLFNAERRLRLLIGLPINDGTLIRPVTEPVVKPVHLDWEMALAESLQRRPELRRQRQRIKRRELELAASKNFLKPRFDAVGRYRVRGFGKDLIDNRGDNADRFDNAVENLTNLDFQEWQVGFEFSIPLGFRQAHAAVRNAELMLARERTILREQERQIVRNLSDAVADLRRSKAIVTTAYNRLRAAKTRVASLEAVKPNQEVSTPDQLLEAHSRLADAESRYFLALVEYMLAVRNVHYEKGSLLEAKGVQLQDAYSTGPLPKLRSVPPLHSLIPELDGPEQPPEIKTPPAPGMTVPDVPSPKVEKAPGNEKNSTAIEPISARPRFGDILLDDPLLRPRETKTPRFPKRSD